MKISFLPYTFHLKTLLRLNHRSGHVFSALFRSQPLKQDRGFYGKGPCPFSVNDNNKSTYNADQTNN